MIALSRPAWRSYSRNTEKRESEHWIQHSGVGVSVWAIVWYNLFRLICCKELAQNGDSFRSRGLCHLENFSPFWMSINGQEEHLTLEGAREVDVNSLSWFLRPSSRVESALAGACFTAWHGTMPYLELVSPGQASCNSLCSHDSWMAGLAKPFHKVLLESQPSSLE